MSKTYAVLGLTRELMIYDKPKLYRIGGERTDDIKKWAPEHKGTPARSGVAADDLAHGGAA